MQNKKRKKEAEFEYGDISGREKFEICNKTKTIHHLFYVYYVHGDKLWTEFQRVWSSLAVGTLRRVPANHLQKLRQMESGFIRIRNWESACRLSEITVPPIVHWDTLATSPLLAVCRIKPGTPVGTPPHSLTSRLPLPTTASGNWVMTCEDEVQKRGVLGTAGLKLVNSEENGEYSGR